MKKKDKRMAFEACPARGTVDVLITDISNQIDRARPETRTMSRDENETRKLDERLYII